MKKEEIRNRMEARFVRTDQGSAGKMTYRERILLGIAVDVCQSLSSDSEKRSMGIDLAFQIARSIPHEQAVKEIKANLSGKPITTEIEGRLEVILIN